MSQPRRSNYTQAFSRRRGAPNRIAKTNATVIAPKPVSLPSLRSKTNYTDKNTSKMSSVKEWAPSESEKEAKEAPKQIPKPSPPPSPSPDSTTFIIPIDDDDDEDWASIPMEITGYSSEDMFNDPMFGNQSKEVFERHPADAKLYDHHTKTLQPQTRGRTSTNNRNIKNPRHTSNIPQRTNTGSSRHTITPETITPDVLIHLEKQPDLMLDIAKKVAITLKEEEEERTKATKAAAFRKLQELEEKIAARAQQEKEEAQREKEEAKRKQKLRDDKFAAMKATKEKLAGEKQQSISKPIFTIKKREPTSVENVEMPTEQSKRGMKRTRGNKNSRSSRGRSRGRGGFRSVPLTADEVAIQGMDNNEEKKELDATNSSTVNIGEDEREKKVIIDSKDAPWKGKKQRKAFPLAEIQDAQEISKTLFEPSSSDANQVKRERKTYRGRNRGNRRGKHSRGKIASPANSNGHDIPEQLSKESPVSFKVEESIAKQEIPENKTETQKQAEQVLSTDSMELTQKKKKVKKYWEEKRRKRKEKNRQSTLPPAPFSSSDKGQ